MTPNLTDEYLQEVSSELRKDMEKILQRKLTDQEFSLKVLLLASKSLSILKEGFIYEM